MLFSWIASGSLNFYSSIAHFCYVLKRRATKNRPVVAGKPFAKVVHWEVFLSFFFLIVRLEPAIPILTLFDYSGMVASCLSSVG